MYLCTENEQYYNSWGIALVSYFSLMNKHLLKVKCFPGE